jgi:hypothetical protein
MSTMFISLLSVLGVVLAGVITTVLKFCLDCIHHRSTVVEVSTPEVNLKHHKLFEKFAFYKDHISRMQFGDEGRNVLVQYILTCFAETSEASWSAFVESDRNALELTTIQFHVLQMYNESIIQWEAKCLAEGIPKHIFDKFLTWSAPYQKVFCSTVYHISRHAVFSTVDSKLSEILDSITFNLDLFLLNADINLKSINGDLDGLLFHGVRLAFRAFKGNKELVFRNINGLCNKYDSIALFSIFDCPDVLIEIPALFVSKSLCLRTGFSESEIIASHLKCLGLQMTTNVRDAIESGSSLEFATEVICTDKSKIETNIFLLPISSNENCMLSLLASPGYLLREDEVPQFRDLLSTMFNRDDPVMVVWLNAVTEITHIEFPSKNTIQKKVKVGQPFIDLLKQDLDKNAYIMETVLSDDADLPLPLELSAQVNFGRACVTCSLVVYKIKCPPKGSDYIVLIFPVWDGRDGSNMFTNQVTVGELQTLSWQSYA